jgi:hypothetical protein
MSDRIVVEAGAGGGQMEWVGVICDVLYLLLQVALWAGGWADSGSVKDRRVGRGRSGGQDGVPIAAAQKTTLCRPVYWTGTAASLSLT